MKRLCVILVLLLCLCACGQIAAQEETSTAATITTTETELNKNVSVAEYYKAVLRGQTDIMLGRSDQFAVQDIDGDGMQEVILGQSGDVCLVLYWNGKEVQTLPLEVVEVHSLKADGTLWFINGNASAILGKFLPLIENKGDIELLAEVNHTGIYYSEEAPSTLYYINSERVSIEEFDAFCIKQDAKPDAIWLELTEENIAKTFG